MLLKRKEAAQYLRIEPKTLDDWVKRAGMAYAGDTSGLDKRVKLLSEEQVRELAGIHGRPFRSIEERLSELEQRLESLETVRRPFVPLDPLPSIPATPRPVQRVVASSYTGHHSAGHHDPLPDGWVAWIRFSEDLGIPGTTARRYLHDRVIPFEQGAWDSGVANRPYEYALTPEQQEEARRIIRELRGQ